MKQLLSLILVLTLFIPCIADAKKKKKEEEQKQTSSSTTNVNQSKIDGLSADDKRQFDALSDEQKAQILKGKVDIGFNEFMVNLAIGKPYYGTEHHPVYVDYEQVWLYIKPDIKTDVKEEKIIDPQTNWPTIHKTTSITSCMVGDFFLLFDRGVVNKIVPANDGKTYGSCSLETSEEFIPIVNK